jgi:glycosyltransferase involved in cell wall biosynthesis
MRILMAADFYRPFIGGAERQSELLSRELVQRGYDVHLVTTWHKGLPELEDREGVTVHRLKALSTLVPWFSSDPNRRFHPPMPDPLMVWNLRRLLRRIKPDVIHAYGWVAYSCAAAVLGTRIPMLISVRDYGYICATRGLLYRGKECSGPALAKCLHCASDRYGAVKGIAAVGGVFLGRPLLLRHVTGIHAISSYVQRVTRRDLLRSATNVSDATALVPDFVIPSFLEQLPVADTAFVDQLPKGPFILFVGALQEHKGLYELVAAYGKLRNAPHLVLIGTRWPDTPDKFPPGISVYHNVDHASVMASWERCLFGVITSRWPEPLGVVALEAMSRAKAVVASAIGGIPDMVVDGETGLLFPPGNVEGLRAGMQRLIDDPELRTRLGEAGFERVTRFTADAVMPAYEELYRRATAAVES